MNSIYYMDWPVGAHTAFTGKISDTLWTSINFGMIATQFFMGSPQGFNRANISDLDIIECKKIIKRWPIKVFSHFPYVANLAGSKDQLAWSGNDKQDNKTIFLLKGLEYELSILAQLDGGVVIHPGNYPDRKRGLEAIAKSINTLDFNKKELENSKLLLENSAGQGTSLATTFQEIKDIIDLVEYKNNIGVCIDTCHIYAAGQYNLSDIKEIDRMFQDFDKIIGSKFLTLLHLNDSQDAFNSKKDRHACLGTGNIWSDSFESLIYLLDICKNRNIPIILETHGMDMITLFCLKNYRINHNK